MDAVKILGSLLSNNAMGSKTGQSVLESLLGGGGGNQNNASNILSSLLGGGKRSGGNAGLGALGALLGAASQNQKGGGSGLDMLGSLLGGAGGSSQQSGGLGALAGLLGGGGGKSSGGGGLGGLVGGLLGGSGGGKSSGGLGSLLGAAAGGGSGSDLLGSLLGAAPGPVNEPPQEAHDEAEILIEAMCNAAKVDGNVDGAEQQEILGKLGDLEPGEVEFVKAQLASPLDLDGFLAKVPKDMAHQVYSFSLMAVKLDSQAEAEYFGKLAGGLGIDGDTANQIHEQMGEPEIFA